VSREDTDGVHGTNVIATKTGTIQPETILEIGAHVDTDVNPNRKGTPGASDNASGVAAIKEIATVLKDYPNRKTIRFIIYVGEEEHLVGSIKHVLNAAQRHDQLEIVLVMDGIGWSELQPNYMNCIWPNHRDIESLRLAKNFDYVRKTYGINIGWRYCGAKEQYVSDHMPYWDYHYPSVLSIGGIPYNDPDYHRCSDVMKNADVMNAFLTMQENLGVLMLYDLDKDQYFGQGASILREYWSANPLSIIWSSTDPQLQMTPAPVER
jgi:hypothetical protein